MLINFWECLPSTEFLVLTGEFSTSVYTDVNSLAVLFLRFLWHFYMRKYPSILSVYPINTQRFLFYCDWRIPNTVSQYYWRRELIGLSCSHPVMPTFSTTDLEDSIILTFFLYPTWWNNRLFTNCVLMFSFVFACVQSVLSRHCRGH